MWAGSENFQFNEILNHMWERKTNDSTVRLHTKDQRGPVNAKRLPSSWLWEIDLEGCGLPEETQYLSSCLFCERKSNCTHYPEGLVYRQSHRKCSFESQAFFIHRDLLYPEDLVCSPTHKHLTSDPSPPPTHPQRLPLAAGQARPHLESRLGWK